ncbi:MAG: UvrD-helicase domain-containing protein [Parachlamydiaceae bacterium]
MKTFQVLDRHLNLHQHYLLEASAGTGKTFSIQNIVVRLLIESKEEAPPLLLQKILVVTFTKAATRDLKIRIRANIEEAILYLQSWQIGDALAEQAPDYLKRCMEKGEEAVLHARRALQQAMFTFDQAPIFTIHSFCARMLRQFAIESDMGLHALGGDEPLPQSEITGVIRDFFRTEVRLEKFSPSQLEMLLKCDPQQKTLLRLIQTGSLFPSFPDFKETCIRFHQAMHSLKQRLNLSSEKLIEDFHLQAVAYRNYKAGETKAETLEKVTRFAQLFDEDNWHTEHIDGLIQDGLVWVKALNPSLLKGKAPPREALHYPNFTSYLEDALADLLEEAADNCVLMARVAKDCQELLKRYQHEEEKLAPDDILRKMKRALDHPTFVRNVQSNFEAAIIDEFQDTDPLQWKIFHHLFVCETSVWNGSLYLVGDPKQSIYSFRQADIYTYLAAAQALGEDHCFSLNVNYRSQPCLVEALNTLFDPHHLPDFIPLPKHSLHLPYQPVEAAESNRVYQIDDGQEAMHFFIADAKAFKNPKLTDLELHIFFPFIAKEITRLREKTHLGFPQFAVLVRDRHQALRLAQYFDQFAIPYLNQRGTSLADSAAHLALTDLIRAVLHPQNRSAIRTALGSPLLGWTHTEIKTEGSMEFMLLLVQRLRQCLVNQGFSLFFEEMLHTKCKKNGPTILEQILSREGGLDFFRDLRQIADLIIDHQYTEWNSPEGLIPFLDRLYVWQEDDDKRIKRFQDPTTDGVKILTLHYSKGLEFDIVFALGLVNRTAIKEDLIPIEIDGQIVLSPAKEDSQDYLNYCEECDAEKMRQFYVALTRAKSKLYIPIALHLPSERLYCGEAAPMDLFIARIGQPLAHSYGELYKRIKESTGEHFLNFLERVGKDHFMTYTIHQNIFYAPPPEKPLAFESPLTPPSCVKVEAKPLWMTSFSSMSSHFQRKKEAGMVLEKHPPHQIDSQIKDPYTLPANSETGILIHHILEKLNFHDFKPLNNHEEALPLIRPFVQKSFLKGWDLQIAQLIFNTLKTPLSDELGEFCLADLKPTDLYREMPFIFPYQRASLIEEIECKEGLMKGVIDCLFICQGTYFLLDWKTNWLGSTPDAYSHDHVELAMKENAYHLQGKIYSEALRRYLKLVERRPFEECFGGFFYLFMRGIQPGNKNGIYYASNSLATQNIPLW